MRLEIIGHVGIESHYLLAKPPFLKNSIVSKGEVSQILSFSSLLGGSATFAAFAARRIGAAVNIRACVGKDEDGKIVKKAFEQFFALSLPDQDKRTEHFLSLWYEQKKYRDLFLLLNNSLPSPMLDADACIFFGVPNEELFKIRRENHSTLLSLVPNQSLAELSYPLERLLELADIVFVNIHELMSSTSYFNEEKLFAYLNKITQQSKGSVVVTKGKAGVRCISNNRNYMVDWIQPSQYVSYPIGGGDLLATCATLFWHNSSSNNAVKLAVDETSKILEEIQPFGKYPSALDLSQLQTS